MGRADPEREQLVARVTELELRWMEQQAWLDTLDGLVREQDQRIDRLERRVDGLLRRLDGQAPPDEASEV